MKSKKLLLTIKDLKDLGLIGKRKKKSRRKRKADKKMVVPNSVISGVRSEFIGPTFGTQINRTTDLQNENIRLQNEKLLENVKTSENQNRTLLQLIEDNTANRQAITDADTTNRRAIEEIYTYGNRLQNQITQLDRIQSDSVDVPKSGDSKYFDGNPTIASTKLDLHPNENQDTYNKSTAVAGGASVPLSQLKREKSIEKIVGSISLTPSKSEFEDEEPEPEPEWSDEETKPVPKTKNISKLTKDEMVVRLRELGYQESVIGLNKFELYSKLKVLQPRKKRSTKTKT